MGVTRTRLDLRSTQEVYNFPLHDMHNKNISTNRITTHYTSLCHTGHNHLDGYGRQTHAYPRQRFSRLPAGMHEKLARMITNTSISIYNSKENPICALMRMILSSHKIAYAPSQGDVVTISTTSKNTMPGFRMLAFKCTHVGCTFWRLPFSPKSYFEKYSNNTYFKNSTKKLFGKFSNKY